MILRRKDTGGANDGGAGGTGIDEIARRLDELVRTVSHVSDGEPTGIVKDGILQAARSAWNARRERQRIFGHSIAPDPAWDILLDLFIARMEDRQVTVSSVGAAIGSSDSTIVRWAAQLIEAKLVSSAANDRGGKDRILALTEDGLKLMCDYFIRTSPDLDAAAA